MGKKCEKRKGSLGSCISIYCNDSKPNAQGNGNGGREVEFNIENAVLQWRYAGDTAWVDLISIPQPSLVLSPHLWPIGVEVDLGDGSYGIRHTGLMTVTTATVMQVQPINATFTKTNTTLLSYGGNVVAQNGNVHPIPFGFLNWLCSIYINVDGLNVAFQGGTAGTAQYDVWVRYTKI